MTTSAEPPPSQIFRSAALLCTMIVGGLALGAAFPASAAVRPLAIPALALQTLMTVGNLPRAAGERGLRERGDGQRERTTVRGGLDLLVLHHLTSTLPLVALAAVLGVTEPLGFGVLIMGIAPPAALVPAYAEVLAVDVRPVLVFALVAYGLSLVATPLALLIAVGATVGVGPIALTLGGGLIVPSLVARAGHPLIARLPQALRRGVVNASVFVITLGLGGGIVEGLSATGSAPALLSGLTVLLVARTFGSGALARRLARPELRDAAPLAGAFKNIALSAAVGAALFGPTAALPSLLAFLFEAAYFLALARQGRTSSAQPNRPVT